MIYYLNNEQFDKLWWDNPNLPDHIAKSSGVDHNIRIEYWKEHLETRYQLTYTELSTQYDETEPGFWGMIEGDEKYINWFLLQL